MYQGSSLPKVRVELLVPGGEQRRRDVEPLPVEAELDHLRSSVDATPLDVSGFGLLLE